MSDPRKITVTVESITGWRLTGNFRGPTGAETFLSAMNAKCRQAGVREFPCPLPLDADSRALFNALVDLVIEDDGSILFDDVLAAMGAVDGNEKASKN